MRTGPTYEYWFRRRVIFRSADRNLGFEVFGPDAALGVAATPQARNIRIGRYEISLFLLFFLG
jgi:hypothetical protein